MNGLNDIFFKGYKSFPVENYSPITDIKNINLLIGKNNSGKSSILDVVEACYSAKKRSSLGIQDLEVTVHTFDETLRRYSPQMTVGGVNSINHHIPQRLLRIKVNSRFTGSQQVAIFEISPSSVQNDWVNQNIKNQRDSIARDLTDVFQKDVVVRRLRSDRNINVESDGKDLTLQDDGEGATRLICSILNHEEFDESIIESTLLSALNTIMKPEAEFEEIRVQERFADNNSTWEIFLKEKDCKRYALSQCGSGLKTIILLLINLLVIPMIDKKETKFVFALEELENNLHPALQRKVFQFISKYAENRDVCFFITSHSSTAINIFFGQENAHIYHVQKKDQFSTITPILAREDQYYVFDDLSVKASDILQANGIIWVEGPTDELYIESWLRKALPDKYIRGLHYQFVYYGGRLLSHYSADELENAINLLSVNRNSIIVMDSDKRSSEANLNDTKMRIIGEFEKKNMMYWVTAGKEIENYIDKSLIETMLHKNISKQCERYEHFSTYIGQLGYGGFSRDKFAFAQKLEPLLNSSNEVLDVLDLKEKISELSKRIILWNSE